MASPSKLDDPQWRHERARTAGLARQHPEYRRERKAAAAETYIKRLVDTFPELTQDQRNRLAGLLQGGEP